MSTMPRHTFFFIELLIEKLDHCLYEWRAEPSGGRVVLEQGNGDSIKDCIRAARSILGAAHAVELRYDGYCAGTFTGTQIIETPELYAAKAGDLTRYFKAIEASLL